MLIGLRAPPLLSQDSSSRHVHDVHVGPSVRRCRLLAGMQPIRSAQPNALHAGSARRQEVLLRIVPHVDHLPGDDAQLVGQMLERPRIRLPPRTVLFPKDDDGIEPLVQSDRLEFRNLHRSHAFRRQAELVVAPQSLQSGYDIRERGQPRPVAPVGLQHAFSVGLSRQVMSRKPAVERIAAHACLEQGHELLKRRLRRPPELSLQPARRGFETAEDEGSFRIESVIQVKTDGAPSGHQRPRPGRGTYHSASGTTRRGTSPTAAG